MPESEERRVELQSMKQKIHYLNLDTHMTFCGYKIGQFPDNHVWSSYGVNCRACIKIKKDAVKAKAAIEKNIGAIQLRNLSK